MMLYETKGNGEPIIFLPGLFAGGWIWNSVVRNIQDKGFKTFTFTDPIPVAFEGSQQKALTELDTITENCSTPVYLVGNSLGALIALHYAFQRKDRVKGVIMSGAPGQLEMEAGVSLDELKTGKDKYTTLLGSRIFYDQSKIPPHGIEEVKYLFGTEKIFRNIVRWLYFSRKYDVPDVLQKISIPIDFIWGEYDLITPIEPWIDIAKNFPQTSMTIIKDSGHSPMVEQPELFTEALLRKISSGRMHIK
ncbi:alpha/beta fold hydrolase [Basfia succiniciproducens]|uniref:alpha/beta fold hydrolase n=1 Tax=Basfia succiniciproducens TaxID=653940 RepID=UPI0008CA7256|nr:alpha/beta hydrolase [Basfia succiniciproducens]SEQ71028.1 Pimeloyl-ACP methyl ester carboxylesterase [Basfia succiniciproducens]